MSSTRSSESALRSSTNEACGRDLFLVDAELLDDDLLEAFERGPVCHVFRLLHPIWKRFLERH